MHGAPQFSFSNRLYVRMWFKGCFLCSCLWLINARSSCHAARESRRDTVIQRRAKKRDVLHCLWTGFGFAECDVYGCGVCVVDSVAGGARKRVVSALQTVISPDVQWLLLPPAPPPPWHPSPASPPPPHSSYFQPFIFLHKGKMKKNKTNIWKLKHDREGSGLERVGGGTEEGEAILENKRLFFRSKGWKLVRLLFLKNGPCVVRLLRARYTLFYLPEETKLDVLAREEKKKKSVMVSFKLHSLLAFIWFLTGKF